MGQGIYTHTAARTELQLLFAGHFPEAPLIELLLDGRIVPTPMYGVHVAWADAPSGRLMLIVGRFALLVTPLTATQLATEQGRWRPVDARGVVGTPAAWFTTDAAAGTLFVDLFNVQVHAIRPYPTGTRP
jgi:hypothetical protein